MVITMFEKPTIVIGDFGTSFTRIATENGIIHEYPTLIAYDDNGKHIGENALKRAGAADLVWVKDAARLSKRELAEYPNAFQDFVRQSLNTIEAKPPVDLIMSEPALMTEAARNQITNQLSEIQGIKRIHFFPEAIATAIGAKLKGLYTLVDMGDGNTSVQSFNTAPIIVGRKQERKPLAFQTFRAGRTMTYQTAEVLREFFDIHLDVQNAGSHNYNYVVKIKHSFLSDAESVKVINQNNIIETLPVTELIQTKILECLFNKEQKFRPVHETIKESAMTVKDISPGLLSTVYVTGRPFTSNAVYDMFCKRMNELLKEEKEALEISEIEVKRVPDCSRVVFNGMKRGCKTVHRDSGKWIDLHA